MECKRTEHIKSFIVMDVLERAQELEKQGADIVHLEVGEPDFDTPWPIKGAAIKALIDGETHYTHSLGIRELREAICEYYEQNYGIKNLNPDRVVVTSGSSPAFLIAFGALMNAGDEIILSNPCYACYPNFAHFLQARPVYVNVEEDDGFQFQPERIKEAITNKTKAIMINSPANPTGHLIDADRLQAIAEMDLWIFSDEIYHGLVYDGQKAHSILEFTDKCFVFNGFSKLFAMTGWRLGYVIVPENFVRPVQCMAQNFFISANAPAQRAALAALTHPMVAQEVNKMVDMYDKRRKFMIKRLKEIGFKIVREPKGAFYVFANAKEFSQNSFELAFEILENAHVGVTPGIDFGSNGEGFLRFCYANSLDLIERGLQRIEEYLHSRTK